MKKWDWNDYQINSPERIDNHNTMKKNETIVIRKASGKEEFFSFQKLRNSLLRSNATENETDEIVEKLKPQLYQGISTKKIYSLAFRMLKEQSSENASRYYLKKGIMELGPSGFPFEKYVSHLFEHEGFSTEVGVILPGKCVTHEIDVICKKEETLMLMECKYKNQSGINVDVKVPLYIHSRFQDLLQNDLLQKPFTTFKGWIVTNSRFTEDALAFGHCSGINLLGWDLPFKNSLKDIIDRTGLYPITCLSSLTQIEKKWFLEKGIVLISDLSTNHKLFSRAKISEKRSQMIIAECEKLSNPKLQKIQN